MTKQIQYLGSPKKQTQKDLLVEQFKKIPIVQIACEKTGVSRASYYRWRKEDPTFARESDSALVDGSCMVNDMAESQLISAIRDKNMTAIIFWLKHHHETYTTRVNLTGLLKVEHTLSKEDEEIVRMALQLGGIDQTEKEI